MVRQKIVKIEKKLPYVAPLMDFDRPHDRVEKKALWQPLKIYGSEGNFLADMRSFSEQSNT